MRVMRVGVCVCGGGARRVAPPGKVRTVEASSVVRGGKAHTCHCKLCDAQLPVRPASWQQTHTQAPPAQCAGACSDEGRAGGTSAVGLHAVSLASRRDRACRRRSVLRRAPSPCIPWSATATSSSCPCHPCRPCPTSSSRTRAAGPSPATFSAPSSQPC